MNRKGFTLMEILAVLLILAVVTSFALPGIRAIRDEIYYAQAKSAAVKMADAMRSFYKETKGRRISGQVTGRGTGIGDRVTGSASLECTSAPTGIPVSNNGTADMKQLFACGYLSEKDFAGLPYEFRANSCLYKDADPKVLVKAIGTDAAGRHSTDAWCVRGDSSVTEVCPNEPSGGCQTL